jgi:hypothetical protein
MSIRSKGQYVVKRQRARYRETAEASQIIVPYVGPYDTLWSGRPAINSTISGFPGDHKVKEVAMEDGRANDGRLIVTLEKPNPGSTGSDENTQIGETLYELDWGEERRPLEEHKKMPILKTDRLVYEFPDKAYDAATNAGWSSTDDAPAGKTGRQRTWDDWAAMDGGDVNAGEWSIDDYKGLRRKGYEDYPVSFPIARVTIYAKYRINPVGSVWTTSSPPSQCGAPTGWTYVKTASRSSKQGRLYTLIEEWRGFNRVDSLFFL